MKAKLELLTLLFCSTIITSCEYDNYDQPGSKLEGEITYQGEPIGVSYNDVKLELWQPGWEQKNRIDVSVDQNGGYSALLFNGTYKLIIPSHEGPFMSTENDQTGSDTIMIELQGSTKVNIEVLPYYMIRNVEFSRSGTTISSACALEKIVSGVDERNIEQVSLYLSKTGFVDARNDVDGSQIPSIAGQDIVDLNNIDLERNIPDIKPAQSFIYARIGVKLDGVSDMIFSRVQKIDL